MRRVDRFADRLSHHILIAVTSYLPAGGGALTMADDRPRGGGYRLRRNEHVVIGRVVSGMNVVREVRLVVLCVSRARCGCVRVCLTSAPTRPRRRSARVGIRGSKKADEQRSCSSAAVAAASALRSSKPNVRTPSLIHAFLTVSRGDCVCVPRREVERLGAACGATRTRVVVASCGAAAR